jgi:hypothetical protein
VLDGVFYELNDSMALELGAAAKTEVTCQQKIKVARPDKYKHMIICFTLIVFNANVSNVSIQSEGKGEDVVLVAAVPDNERPVWLC